MEHIIVRRDNVNAYYAQQHFWLLAASGSFLRSDLMYDHASGQFLPAGSFPDLEAYLPPKGLGDIVEDLLTGVASAAVVIGAGLVAGMLLENLFSPSSPPLRKAKYKAPNFEPLERWKREFVRLRHAEICDYCSSHDPQGHVDHKTSRADGGSNHLRNLTWACASCNCSKGRMGARQFRALMAN